jgi:hypothetical protein
MKQICAVLRRIEPEREERTRYRHSGWQRDLFIKVGSVLTYLLVVTVAHAQSPPTSHLRLWLKADTGVTTDTSNGVSTWADQSGNSYNATQTTAASRPTLQTNALNGYPIIQFNSAATHYLNISNVMTGLTQAEIFAVVRANTVTGNNGLWSFGGNPWEWYSGSDGTIQSAFGTNTAIIQGVPQRDITKFRIYQICSQTGTWQSWIDGALFYETKTNTVAVTNPALLGRNGGGYGFYGDMAEVLIYSQPLSSADRASVIAYLNGKYGIFSAPSAPTGIAALQLSSTENMISWDWQEADKQITYVIERKTGMDGTYAQIGTSSNDSVYLDTTAVAGQNYYYRVYATNSGGNSDYSDETAVSTPMAEGGSVPSSGLNLWLMADSLVSTPVEVVTDYSGSGNDALQTTVANRPTLLANALNGKPAIHFVGTSSQYLSLPNFMSGWTSSELFVVLRSTYTNVNSGPWMLGSQGYAWYSGSDGSIEGEFGTSYQQLEGVPSQSVLQFNLYEAYSQAGLYQSWVNGAPLFQSTTNGVGFSTTPRLGTNYGYYFSGDIAEMLIYNRALSDAERKGVRTYLSLKYQLVAAAATPTNFEANELNAQTSILTWDGTLANTSVDYAVWRQQDGGAWTQIATVSNLSMYVDSGLVGSSAYSYEVEAITAGGGSALTAAVTLNRLLPQVSSLPTAGMKLWLMADELVSSPVAVMTDYSGSGNDATQITYANRPTLLTNAVNGHPAVHFTAASDQYLNLPNLMSGATAGEIFAVVRAANATGNIGLWYLSPGWSWYPGSTGVTESGFATGGSFLEGVPPLPITQFHAYQISGQANLYQVWFDGQPFYQMTTNTVGWVPTPRIGVNTGGYYFNGDIAEIIIYNRALTPAERKSVLQYLGIKYLLPGLDTDGDGLTNAQEAALGSNPLSRDTNGDGLFDGISVAYGINPVTPGSLYPNPSGPPTPTPPASEPGTMVITLTTPAGATLLP